MQQNNTEDNLDSLTEASREEKKQTADVKQKVSKRLSYIRSMMKLPLNPTVGAQAVLDFVKTGQKNPKSPQYEILRKLSKQKRDAITTVNSAVPISAVLNASDGQLRRIVRDAMKEETQYLKEEFNPPAMLLLKRQAVRLFPGSQRVVLYTDNKYGLTFTVPYDAQGRGFTAVNTAGLAGPGIQPISAKMVAEETDHGLSVVLTTGDEVVIDRELADKIETVFNSLNETNKVRMNDMLLESKESFDRVIKFVESFE
jgi:hypothetical protein